MCLIAWNWQPHTDTPLLLLGNRDEFYARPSLPLHWWEGSDILAGRDLKGGGTWLGVTRHGRMAALTNYRDLSNFRADAPSRGALTINFLQGQLSAAHYLMAIRQTASQFNPFNLLVYDGAQLMALESRHLKILTLQPGIGAVSNADFLTPWPKLQKLKSSLAQLAERQLVHRDEMLMALLRDEQAASDQDLPPTGLTLARERALSSVFISTPDYGTRASTLLRFTRNGLYMQEESFDRDGSTGSTCFRA